MCLQNEETFIWSSSMNNQDLHFKQNSLIAIVKTFRLKFLDFVFNFTRKKDQEIRYLKFLEFYVVYN